MRTRLLVLSFVTTLSACVTTTYRDGKPIENPSKDSSSFSLVKPAATAAVNADTNVRVELIPHKDNPELYEYRVLEVFPKTAYWRAGIKAGDVLLSIDGKRVQTMSDAIEVPNRIGAGQFKQILIRRKGKNVLLQAKTL